MQKEIRLRDITEKEITSQRSSIRRH